MSHAPVVATTVRFRDAAEGRVRRIDTDERRQTVLEALADPGCRAILDATSHLPLSANEIADACGLPLSTTYRKLELLTEVELLDERTRIRDSGKHASEYRRSVADVVVTPAAPGGTVLRVSMRKPATAGDERP